MNQMRSHKSLLLAVINLCIIVCVVAAAILNRQYIIDKYNAWEFKPSPEIAQIANDVGLNENGRFYYFASRPELDFAKEFNGECRSREQGNAILGCYKNQRIYIYNVNDERLNGLKEVTAAHEMLHAAYERLPESDKKVVNTLLEKEYRKNSDAEFSKRMDYYKRNQPGEEYNELHSIIGTEFADISPQLEDYYKRYFNNRSQVVALHSKYSDKFKELKQGSASLRKELENLSISINNASLKYNRDISNLNSEINTFNSRAKNGDFSSQEDFLNERRYLIKSTRKLEQDRANINRYIGQYESKRIEYNKLVDESNSMYKAMDSTLAPAPSI
jgi:hypothetical protein